MESVRENIEPPTDGDATATSEQSKLMDQTEPNRSPNGEQQQQAQQQDGQVSPNQTERAAAELGEPGGEEASLSPAEQDQKSVAPQPISRKDQSSYSQMEAFLLLQIDRCINYKNFFDSQGDLSMTTKLDTLASLSSKDLELLKKVWREEGQLPKFKFDVLKMNCVPMNCDVKEKQVEVIVQTSNMACSENSVTYVIAEFNFPPAPSGMTFSRWFLHFKLNPGRIFFCKSESSNKQFDQVYSTGANPFYDLRNELTEYDRPLSFHVDKGKSKTLKRKYKPIRLEFYEKTGLFRLDRKIGIVHVNIDAISDEATINTRLPIILGRKETGAYANITVKVREPLVDKKIRAHEEKILLVF